MDNNIFLVPFFSAFSISAFLLLLIIKFVKNNPFFIQDERKSPRHIHKSNVSRFGGMAVILAFVSVLILDGKLVISSQLFGVIIACLAIMVVGIFDDLRELSWRRQLLFQTGIALFVFLLGIRLEYVTNPLGGVFLFGNGLSFVVNLTVVVCWILLIINAMNWVDGIDGVSGGISAIGAMTIFLVSLRPEVNQPPVAIIAVSLLGSVVAFIIFNFNPAKILAGTSGSVFFGFILAILAIFAGAKIATTLLVLAVPIIDAMWVILERLKSGKRVFEADKKHLHYRLLELGWSQKKICIFYWLLTALIAVMALSMGARGKIIIFLTVCALMVFFYFSIGKIRTSNL